MGLHAYSRPADEFWTAVMRKPADESLSSSTTLQNDDHFSFPVVADGSYYFELLLLYDGSATADIKHAFAISAGSFGIGWRKHDGVGPTTAVAQTGVVADMTTAIVNAKGGEQTLVSVTGFFVSTAAAVVTLQWAQNASDAAAITVKAGSMLRWRELV